MREEREYKFSYVVAGSLPSLYGKRIYTTTKAISMEAAHEKGKQDALKQYPQAHGFLTEAINP